MPASNEDKLARAKTLHNRSKEGFKQVDQLTGEIDKLMKKRLDIERKARKDYDGSCVLLAQVRDTLPYQNVECVEWEWNEDGSVTFLIPEISKLVL